MNEKTEPRMLTFRDRQFPCCTSLTMGIIGGKWKTVILYHLMVGEKMRYNELRKTMPTVTERTLSLQLQALEDDGVVRREVFHEKPPLKVEYSLTDFGKTLKPLILAIADWGEQASKEYV